MAYNEANALDLESTRKTHARELIETLALGNVSGAVQLIHELNQVRDRGLYQEVGKLTRELHNAIVNFQIDPASPHAQEVSQIADATDRLGYVVKMTEKAANRTMDLVEESTPLLGEMSQAAQGLRNDWGASCAGKCRPKNFVIWPGVSNSSLARVNTMPTSSVPR